MKHKDIIILKKIIEYCDQCNEAVTMFDNDFDKFKHKNTKYYVDRNSR